MKWQWFDCHLLACVIDIASSGVLDIEHSQSSALVHASSLVNAQPWCKSGNSHSKQKRSYGLVREHIRESVISFSIGHVLAA